MPKTLSTSGSYFGPARSDTGTTETNTAVVIIRNILYFVRKRQTVRSVLKKTNVRRARPLREGKVRKEFWLDPSLLRRAQKDLGAATEREAVEIALSLVAFGRELRTGVRALRTLKLSRID